LILGLYSSEQEGHNPYKGRETYTGSCEGMYYNYFCQLCVWNVYILSGSAMASHA